MKTFRRVGQFTAGRYSTSLSPQGFASLSTTVSEDTIPLGYSFIIDTLGNYLTDGAGNRLIAANG